MKFLQYLRPDGRARQVQCDRPEGVEAGAAEIEARGWRFEAEVLATGDVSLTVFNPETEEDVAIEVVENGPGVPAAVDRLVATALDLPAPPAEGE